jgi:hypothetical protein
MPRKHPPYLTLALGAGAVTPWQQLAAYSIFANGGYRITPYIVRQILDDKGTVLGATQPALAGDEALRAIDARNAWLMDSMMHDVVRRGTATRAAAALKRGDLAGKTGTTNDYIDAWFCGYQPTVVGVAWIGFDQPKRMGNGETGGAAALPIWIGFMEHALKNVPESWQETPEGLVPIVANDPAGKTSKELIYKELLPTSAGGRGTEAGSPTQEPAPVQDAKPKPVEKPAAEKPPRKSPKKAGRKEELEPRAERNPGLFGDGARQRSQQFLAIARAEPAPALGPEVVAARLGRQPDFARRAVAIDDDLRTVFELDLDHAAGLGFEIEIGDAAFARRLQRRLDARQLRIGRHHEFPFIHRVLPSLPNACRDTPQPLPPCA